MTDRGRHALRHDPGEPTVFIVEDDGRVRHSLAVLIESSGFRVEAHDSGAKFLDAFDTSRPGCLLLDLRLPGEIDGFAVQDELASRGAAIPIIVLTGHGNVATSVRALKAGAVDFFQKPVRPRELLAAVEKALEVDRRARERRAEGEHLQLAVTALTPRQREVLAQMLRGRTAKETAVEFDISARTVEGHRRWILQRLGVSSVAELLAKFLLAKRED